MSKTEYMAVNSSVNFQILIFNKQMKQIDNFKYLGVWVTKEERIETHEIKNRIDYWIESLLDA